MSPKGRPLSPHLQIYRPQLTSVMSICHRFSGIALAVGTLLLVYWLPPRRRPRRLRPGPELCWLLVRHPAPSGWTVALFYHLCNGIRHLFWDAGYGFELPQAYASGWAVVIATAVFTLLVWVIGIIAI